MTTGDPPRAPARAFLPVHETKAVSVSLKQVSGDGEFEGYASLFGKEDLARDVVMPGAFAASLAARARPGASPVKLLYQHDPAEPIGVWLDLREDAKGLYARGRLLPALARAREVLSLMREGVLDGLSIGYRTVRGERDARSGVRHLTEVDLWEISVVTFPMLPEARVALVKSGADRPPRNAPRAAPTERELERWLTRDAGLSRSEARGFIAKGYRSLAAAREAGGAGRPDSADLAGLIRKAARAFNSSVNGG